QTLSKSLSVGDIANSHNFSHKISKGIANATSTALLESAIYGSSLEKSLIKNLRGEVANAVASEIFTDYVKPLDKDTLIDNITHKLAAGLTGCLSAKAAGNRCEAGSIGAVVGEMWGDYQVDDSNTLTQDEKDKLINQAKLIAGITAAFAGEDVNVAAGVAAEAVENNAVWAAIPAIIYVLDKAYTAYQVYQDIQDLKSGKKTVEQLAREKGESYITQAIVGNIGKYGYKIVKSSSRRIVQA
ncbi:FHA-like protein, partial [Moraxella catarrhalis BC7]